MSNIKKVIEDLNIAIVILAFPQMLNHDMCIKVGQAISAAIDLLKEQGNCENCAIAIEDRQPIVRCKDCRYSGHCNTEDLHRCTNPDGWFCADGKRRSDDN